ncbi:hypothetical protein D3C76_1310490 [compost metagenome]
MGLNGLIDVGAILIHQIIQGLQSAGGGQLEKLGCAELHDVKIFFVCYHEVQLFIVVFRRQHIIGDVIAGFFLDQAGGEVLVGVKPPVLHEHPQRSLGSL